MFRRKKHNKQSIESSQSTGINKINLFDSSNPIYKTIFDSTFDGVVVQDQNGKIIASNKAAQEILQLSQEKLNGRTSLSSIWKSIHQDGSDFSGETHPAMVALKTGKQVENVVMGLSTPNIKTKWLRVSARPLFENNVVTSVVATFTDISDKIEQSWRDEQHSSILQGISDAIYSKDLSGAILSWNNAAEKLYGYTEQEAIGKSIHMIIPKDHDDAADIMHNIKQGRSLKNYNTIRRKKDGTLVEVTLSVSPIYSSRREVVGAAIISRDISHDKQQLKKLTDLKDRFTFATESAKIGVWEWDLKSDDLLWDDRMYKLYGVSHKEFSGTFSAWKKVVHPDDKKRFETEINKAVSSGVSFNTTFRAVWPGGNVRYIRAFGKPINNDSSKNIKLVGVNWDVTDEVENVKSIERFKLAVESAYDHVIICDNKGRIIYANNSATKTTGYSIDEMLGNTPNLWGGQMPKEFYQEMWHTISTLKQPFVGEVNNVRKGGEPYIAEAHISPIVDETGKNVEFYLGIERDITLLKEIDKSKTEFVSLASHQLRTPLSAVNWYAELLQDEATGKLNSDQKAYVNEIYAGNQRMVALVNALLNISRLELGTFEISPKITNPGEIVDAVLKELEPQIEKYKLKITNNSKDSPSKYNADPELLLVIIQNLLSNAVKYTPSNGVVTFSVGFVADKFVFTVSDSGRGIPAHQKDKIFTKLFRADNVRELEIEGTGLGLYIVKSIVEQSGGKISFTSQLNKGTTFVVELPKSGMQKKQGSKRLE